MKRFTSILLAVFLLFTCVPLVANADNENGEFLEISSYGGPYYYTDAYFNTDASVYNPSLCTMSVCLAYSGGATGNSDYTKRSENAVAFLENIGCTNIEINEDYLKVPEIDTMGVVVGSKKITCTDGDYTLVVVVPRSEGYEAEWANNFTMGESGESKGFSQSAKIIEDFVDEYAVTYADSFEENVKLWIAGYSRGAAVANVTAAHLTDKAKIGSFELKKENIYAYTFEAPMAGNIDVMTRAEAESYTNIHNIVNENDIVTYVSPVDWGFYRYGVDENVIPAERTEENKALFEKAEEYFYQLNKSSLTAVDENGNTVFAYETFQAVDVEGNEIDKSITEFYNDLLTALTMGFGSRSAYAECEDLIRIIISEYLGENYQSEQWTIVYNAFNEKYNASVYTSVQSLKELFIECLSLADIDVEAYEAVSEEAYSALPKLVAAVAYCGYLSGWSDISTLLSNGDKITSAHYIHPVLSFLKAQDVNYNPDAAQLLDCAYYRAEVTDVSVAKTEKTVTKKILFIKIKTTTYKYVIVPNSKAAVKEISWKYTLLGSFTSGDTLSRTSPINSFYVKIVDANDNVTYWHYSYGKISQLDR